MYDPIEERQPMLAFFMPCPLVTVPRGSESQALFQIQGVFLPLGEDFELLRGRFQ